MAGTRTVGRGAFVASVPRGAASRTSGRRGGGPIRGRPTTSSLSSGIGSQTGRPTTATTVASPSTFVGTTLTSPRTATPGFSARRRRLSGSRGTGGAGGPTSPPTYKRRRAGTPDGRRGETFARKAGRLSSSAGGWCNGARPPIPSTSTRRPATTGSTAGGHATGLCVATSSGTV